MQPPLELYQVIRRQADGTSSSSRFDHPLLLAPVIGAFLQMLWTRTVPWLVWPLLVLAAAFITRVLKARPVPRLRPAMLAADGVRIERGFVPAATLASVERNGAVAWLTTSGRERIELRALPSDVERLGRVLDSLTEAMTGPALDPAGERTLTELGGDAMKSSSGPAYRALALERERCLAVVEDAAAAPAARIAAAEVLADVRADDRELHERLAKAAEATANGALREALLRRSG